MAFRLLNQISSIKQLTNGTFRSVSADRSITKLNENAIPTIQTDNWILNLSKRRSQSHPSSVRHYSRSSRETDGDHEISFRKGESESKYMNPFGVSKAMKKYKNELRNITAVADQEYMKAMKRFSKNSAAGIKLGYTLESAERDHQHMPNIEDIRKKHLMNYTRIKSSLQPNNLENFGKNPDYDYRLELTKPSKMKISFDDKLRQGNKRDYGTYITQQNDLNDINVEDIKMCDMDENPIEMHTKELMEWLNSSRNEKQVMNKTSIKNGLLNPKPINSNQSRQLSTFYGEYDPDCPPPPKRKFAPPPKICQVELVDKRPREDCKPPPPKEPPPPIPLPRIPKQPITPPPRVCIGTAICPPRADKDLKIEMKTLPCLPLGNCKCIEPAPLNEGCPLPRLKKKTIKQPIVVCKIPDPCPPRADANYKIKMKELPCLIPGDCPCIPFEMKDVPPLPRLVPKPVPPPPPQICDVEKCPPRADANLVVKRKRLRPLKPNPCCCIEPPPLKEGCPLPRLKASKVCETPNEICKEPDLCPDRADDICEYKVKDKTLPTMIICKNEVSAWEYNFHKRKYSTFACHSDLLKPSTPLFLSCNFMSTSQEYVCDANICPGKEEAKNPCKCIEPYIPTYAPRLKRLVKQYDTYFERNYNLEPSCQPPMCPPRADDNVELYVRKSLPYIKAKNCPKIVIKPKFEMACLRRPKRLFQYGDPVHPVETTFERADKDYKYKRKCLPKMKVSTCKCIEPYMPTFKPKLRRLEKKYDTNEPRRCLNTPACGPPTCYRADDAIDLYPQKVLPTLICNKCPKIQSPSKQDPVLMRRPIKRFMYGDPQRNCLTRCQIQVRADDYCKYEVKRKRLRPLLPCNTKPKLPSFLMQKRNIHTTSANAKLAKKKGCKIEPEPKSTCKKTKVSNCPPRARQHCRERYHYKDCTKQNSPYKSFTECSDYEAPTTITECEKSKYLQPRFPQIPEILTVPAPPPKYARIDPKFEELCVYKKMCMVNKGHTRNCDNFYEVKHPLRQSDVADSERVSCNPVDIKCPVVSYEICEQDTCPPKGAGNEDTKNIERQLKQQLQEKENECNRLAEEKAQLECDYQAQCQKFAEEMHTLECEKKEKEQEEMNCRLKNEEKEREVCELKEAKKREELMCQRLEQEKQQLEAQQKAKAEEQQDCLLLAKKLECESAKREQECQKRVRELECKQKQCEMKQKSIEDCQRRNQELECPRRMPDQCRKKKEEPEQCEEKPKCIPKKASTSSSKSKPPCPSPCDSIKSQKAGKATHSNKVNDCKKIPSKTKSCKVMPSTCPTKKEEKCPPVGELLRHPSVNIPNYETEIPIDPEVKRCLAELNKKMQGKSGKGSCGSKSPQRKKCSITPSPCKTPSKTSNVVKFSSSKRSGSSDRCREKQKKDPCRGRDNEDCPPATEYLRQPPTAIPLIEEKDPCASTSSGPVTGCPPIGDLLRHPPVYIPKGDERPAPVDCKKKKCLAEYNKKTNKEDKCKPKKPQCKVKSVSSPNLKCKPIKVASACDLLKSPKKCPNTGVPKPLLQRIIDFFRARPNCPAPGEWKRKELRLQAEKAAKAAGLCVCEPQPKRCSSAPALKCKISTTGNPPCKPPPSRCPPVSKCSYSTKATASGTGKKCKVAPVDCKNIAEEPNKFTKKKKEDISEQPKTSNRCGSIKASCKKESSGECKLNPMKNCPPGLVRPCKGKPIHKDCCYVEAPYASYTDLHTKFSRIPTSECAEQALRVYMNRDKRIKPREKKRKGKCDNQKRSFSTFIQSRYYSSKPRIFDPFHFLDPKYESDNNQCETLDKIMVSIKEKTNSNSIELYYNLFKCLRNMELTECRDITYINKYNLMPEAITEDNSYQEAVTAFYKAATKPKLGISFEDYEAIEMEKTKLLQAELDHLLDNNE